MQVTPANDLSLGALQAERHFAFSLAIDDTSKKTSVSEVVRQYGFGYSAPMGRKHGNHGRISLALESKGWNHQIVQLTYDWNMRKLSHCT